MTHEEKARLYEDMIWLMARIVKTAINKADNRLNESVGYKDDFEQLASAIKYELIEAYKVLNEKEEWTEKRIKDYLSKHSEITSRKQFQLNNQSAYNAAKRLDILDDLLKPKYNNWNEENIRVFLDNHPEIKTRNDFRKSNESAYNAAKRLGILDDLVEHIYHNWTKEECKELASKCRYRSDFEVKYNSAYQAAKRNGWFEEITSHMPKQKGEYYFYNYNYVVYVYEIKETHAAYVGLTYDMDRRDKQHRNANEDGYDSLGLYCIKNDIDIPDPIIKKEHLNSTQARKNEIAYWHQYKNDGWNMINSEKTLGYLGSGSRKWSKEALYKLIEDKPEINTITKLQKFSSGAYEAAKRFQILDELFIRTRTQWTEDNIRQLLIKHPEIKTTIDFKNFNRSAFNAAVRLNIIDQLVDYNKRHWNKNSILQILKENPEIKTKGQFAKKFHSAYLAALRLNIIDELFNNVYNDWTKENLLNFIKENPKIDSIKKLQKASMAAYNAAKRYNLLDDLFTRKHKDWSEENIKKEASKYKTPTEFAKNARRAYQKWLYDYGKPMDWLKQDDDQ